MHTKNTTTLFLAAALATACTTAAPKPDPALTEPTGDGGAVTDPKPEATPAPTAADVLAVFCPPEMIDGDACTVCPPDAPEPDMEGPLRVVNLRAGAFSAPGADEVLVTFEGCAGPPIESESVLLRRNEGGEAGYEVVARNALLHVVTCAFPEAPDGTLLIACMDLDGNQGYNYTNLRQFKPDAELTPVELFELVSDIAACPMGGGEYSNEEGRSLDVGDVDGDGLDDLTVTFDSARGTVPDAFADYCEAEEKGHVFPETTAKTQVFLQKDGGFVVK
jgi:hypothetical protein